MPKIFVEAMPDYHYVIDSPAHGHPIDGVMKEGGAWWTADHVTFTMIRDGVLTEVGKNIDGSPRERDGEYMYTQSPSPDAFFPPPRGGRR